VAVATQYKVFPSSGGMTRSTVTEVLIVVIGVTLSNVQLLPDAHPQYTLTDARAVRADPSECVEGVSRVTVTAEEAPDIDRIKNNINAALTTYNPYFFMPSPFLLIST